MRINAEMYLLINGWMNYLCLRVTASVLRARFRRPRAAAAALLGAGYALAAYMGPRLFRGLFILLAVDGCMAILAFGRRWFAGALLLLPAGFLFSGLAGYLAKRGAAGFFILTASGIMTYLLLPLLKTAGIGRIGPYRLIVRLNGKTVSVPAMRDSGNLLRDPVTGLPVIVADEKSLARLLGYPIDARDLSAMPPGFRLLPIRTAAGRRTLMCVCPDSTRVKCSGKAVQVDAVLAFAALPVGKALLPDGIFENAIGEGYHAGA